MSSHRRLWTLGATLGLWLGASQPALAYIGPGAGFAFLSGGLVLLGALLTAVGVLLIYPVKMVFRLLTGAGRIKGPVKRLVILGLDGFDPRLAQQYMEEGRMPNFKAMAEQGTFEPLGTSFPSMSPVAWSSFSTGVDASRHNIFDFITRDPCTYLPVLTSSEIVQVKGMFPWSKERSEYKQLRKGQSFWKLLGDKKIFSNVIRVPITFPPEEFNGVMLSGMCVPDMRGTQGSFTFWTSNPDQAGPEAGGEVHLVGADHGVVRCSIPGPPNPMSEKGEPLRLPMRVDILPGGESVRLTIGPKGEQTEVEVGVREYSDWVPLAFKFKKVGGTASGIARFYCMGTAPHFGLYMTPIHIDPGNPALPISHPQVYSIYLAKKQGPFATLGLAEDTWALNERVIDEKAFLEQAYLWYEERRKMFADALDKTKKGTVICVFDTTDRIQHMFFRYLDDSHPANADKDTEWGKDVIPDLYAKMDDYLAEVRAKLGPKDRLMVISDHGFCQFKRGVNLNAWLRDEGYLHLKDDAPLEDGVPTSGNWFEAVDWSRTQAFCMGLTGIFINRKARERHGIVEEGEPLAALKAELTAKLTELVDPETGEKIFIEVFDSEKLFSGPYVFEAPDLFAGYKRGYRNSWNCATGAVPKEIFSDNTKSWSGDHCIDPREVPGVFFSDMPINTDTPAITDIAPTALDLFGLPKHPQMQGESLIDGMGVQQ